MTTDYHNMLVIITV